ncbi:MAG: hypothetical protein GYA55_14575 [SAR324 cluster bacterium]|uniref:Aromatic hydrocarbon degradation protein n=1 Tax=SAR324 cluster bacterium TaxID=2024889 RepID=A0A7X9FU53_9DELT|nr:hypothetical protein [SAR324 cluster bacterium]
MKMRWPRIFLSLVVLALLLLNSASAQDNNYWTNQFGLRSNLMGGAVVGGVRDASAGFYNPGALPFVSDPSINVNANAYKVESFKLNNAAGTNENLDSDQVSVVPLLVAGTLTFDNAPDHYLGWSFLTRNSMSMNASLRSDVVADVMNNSYFPGPEDYIGQVLVDNTLQEYWGGLSYGYKVNDSWALGITNFLALRDQETNATQAARAVNKAFSTNVASTDTFNTMDYWNLRLLWKMGVAGNIGNWKLGFAATTPSLDLVGDGTVYRDLTIQNIDMSGDGIPESIVASDRQDGLDATWRSPASLSGGVEYAFSEQTKAGVSAEYFFKQNRYNVIMPKPRDFVRPTGAIPGWDSAEFLRVAYQADPVFNVAAGIEQKLSCDWTGFIGFRTDYSAYKEGPAEFGGFQPGISKWDLYHVTTGAIYKHERSELGLGITYSWGSSDDYKQLANFGNANEQSLLLGTTEQTSADYSSIGLMIGYSYIF